LKRRARSEKKKAVASEAKAKSAQSSPSKSPVKKRGRTGAAPTSPQTEQQGSVLSSSTATAECSDVFTISEPHEPSQHVPVPTLSTEIDISRPIQSQTSISAASQVAYTTATCKTPSQKRRPAPHLQPQQNLPPVLVPAGYALLYPPVLVPIASLHPAVQLSHPPATSQQPNTGGVGSHRQDS